jgi:hypothetical protein
MGSPGVVVAIRDVNLPGRDVRRPSWCATGDSEGRRGGAPGGARAHAKARRVGIHRRDLSGLRQPFVGLAPPTRVSALVGDRREVGPLLGPHPAQAGRRQGMVGQRPVPAASDAGVGTPRVGLFLGGGVLLVVSTWGSDLVRSWTILGCRHGRSDWRPAPSPCASWASTPRKVEGFGRQRASVDAVGCAAQASARARRAVPPRLLEAKGLRVPPARRVRHPGWQGPRRRAAQVEAGRRARRCGDRMTPDLLRCGVLTRRFLGTSRQGWARCLPRRVVAVRAANQT